MAHLIRCKAVVDNMMERCEEWAASNSSLCNLHTIALLEKKLEIAVKALEKCAYESSRIEATIAGKALEEMRKLGSEG